MKQALLGALAVLILLAAGAAWVWRHHPERLPAEWRRQNPHSRDYSPALYRWHDARGDLQITDRPPDGRHYETLRIDPNQNIVPSTLPPGSETR